jgi:hypothetical protein
MRYVILVFAVVIAFAGCTKTKTVTVTKLVDSTVVVYNPTSNSKVVTAASFPLTVTFSQNEIVAAPNALDTVNLVLNFADSVPGSCCSVMIYVNAGASIALTYGSNTNVSLAAGSSLTNPAQGANLIQFIFLGNLYGMNQVSASVTLQP